MKKEKKETRGAKKKLFGTLLNEFFPEKYPYDGTDYSRMNIWYRRLRVNYLDFCKDRGIDVKNPRENLFLTYLLAIYLYYEEPNPKEQASYMKFINHCMQPPQQQSSERPHEKRPIPEDMSFFLSCFKENSIISEKIKKNFSFIQPTNIEHIIKTTEQSPSKIFEELARLFDISLSRQYT